MFALSSRATFMLFAAVSLIATLPARAAREIEPGLWQLTETGIENGQPAKPEVSTDCLSPEDARDPIKTILKDTEGQQCDTLNVKENGNTVVVIEHNLDVIKAGDYLVDIGPEGGDKGGNLVAAGTPEQVARVTESFTGQYLAKILKHSAKAHRA